MYKYLLILCLVFIGCQEPAKPKSPQPDPLRTLQTDIRHIAHVRPSGSAANQQVANYLARELQKSGFQVTRQPFNKGTNIVGIRRGSSARTIIIGSHYDSVNCPGADDNASGCAVNLLVARQLIKQKLNHTLTIIFFDAEEIGLVGSNYYAKSMTAKCDLMINLDMVGNLHVSSTPDAIFNDLYRKYPWARNISFRTGDAPSDHTHRSMRKAFPSSGSLLAHILVTMNQQMCLQV
jgi:Zn-dependent M28 family amino/carboxypeptidase